MKQSSPPQSQPDAHSLFFFIFLFFSLCQTACGEINWWVHAGNRVAIETSHIRLGLEFVTGEKTEERARGRQRGGCVECSLERHRRWSHSQHNVNAGFYSFSSVARRRRCSIITSCCRLGRAGPGHLRGRFSLYSTRVAHKYQERHVILSMSRIRQYIILITHQQGVRVLFFGGDFRWVLWKQHVFGELSDSTLLCTYQSDVLLLAPSGSGQK